MALQKAKITILDKAAIDPTRGLNGEIEVQFNPAEYTLNKEAQIAEIPVYGIDSPILQFIRGQNEKLSLELFFDTTRPGPGQPQSSMGEQGAVDVTTLTRSIYQLVKIQPAIHAPPRILFSWGSLSFKAIVDSVQQKFTLFSPAGVPLRATLTVSFREYKTLEEQLQELNLRSADHTKTWIVAEDKKALSQIAAEVYGDPRRWRAIADHPANRGKIGNPGRLAPGTELEIPPLDARAGQAAGADSP
jgi:hypothetical protein